MGSWFRSLMFVFCAGLILWQAAAESVPVANPAVAEAQTSTLSQPGATSQAAPSPNQVDTTEAAITSREIYTIQTPSDGRTSTTNTVGSPSAQPSSSAIQVQEVSTPAGIRLQVQTNQAGQAAGAGPLNGLSQDTIVKAIPEIKDPVVKARLQLWLATIRKLAQMKMIRQHLCNGQLSKAGEQPQTASHQLVARTPQAVPAPVQQQDVPLQAAGQQPNLQDKSLTKRQALTCPWCGRMISPMDSGR